MVIAYDSAENYQQELENAMWALTQHLLAFPFLKLTNTSKQHLSRPMGKPTICLGENKDADQLRGNREADQRLCFRYSDSTIPLLLKDRVFMPGCLVSSLKLNR